MPSCPAWLQDRTSALIYAIGAKVVDRLSDHIARLQREYECAPSGRKRLAASFKFKATIRLCHLGLKVQQKVQKRHLRKLCIDQLLVEFKRKFGDRGIDPAFLARFDQLPDLFTQIEALADEADNQFYAAYNTIKIHWKNPTLTRHADHGPGE